MWGLQERPTPYRDARLFVIATEDKERTPWYFAGLQQHGIVGRRRLRLELLPTYNGESSPEQVAARLRDYEAKHTLKAIDQLWLVLDVDRWPRLNGTLAAASRDDLRAAISNPCFEIWLQLHFTDTPSAEAPTVGRRAQAAKRAWGVLRADKAGAKPWPFTKADVEHAVERGQAADTGGWRPPFPGSNIHRLVAELLRYSR
jgi:hypothetical protein